MEFFENDMENYESQFETRNNQNLKIARKIKWLQDTIDRLEKEIENAGPEVEDYIIELYKRNIEYFKTRINNLSNGKDEFTGKPKIGSPTKSEYEEELYVNHGAQELYDPFELEGYDAGTELYDEELFDTHKKQH